MKIKRIRVVRRFGVIGSLSKDVFEGRTSTGSEPFSLFICLDANKFVLLSFFSLMKRIYPRVSNKPLPNDAKGPLPVDVRRSTTLLLKFPNKPTESDSEKLKSVSHVEARQDWGERNGRKEDAFFYTGFPSTGQFLFLRSLWTISSFERPS